MEARMQFLRLIFAESELDKASAGDYSGVIKVTVEPM
jgi:hypothetical protein